MRADALAFTAFAALIALLCLRPVLLQHGWPVNHDGAKMFFRTEVFAAHFKQGDYFPVWSGSDAYNYGTPMPTYYQRLFFTVSGVVYLLAHDLKSATVVTLGLLMVTGALGMRAAVAVLSTNRGLRYAMPAAFLLSNYAFTDWLVRGAAAEFAAMMLVPWLLWWSLTLVTHGRFSLSIIAIFGLLFYAHNAIGLISVPLPLLAFLIHLVATARGGRLTPRLLARPAISAAATAALIAPALLMQVRMNRDFDPTTKITQDFAIVGGFRDAKDYVLDQSYAWLTSGGGYSVQLNLVSAITFVALVLFTAARYAKRQRDGVSRPPRPASLLLLVLLGGYSFLQLRRSLSTYNAIPLLPQIQFPWRMLTIITPLLLLAITQMYSPGDRRPPTRRSTRFGAIGAGAWLVAYVLVSPASAHDRLPRLETLHSASNGFYESGEYTPRTRAADGTRDLRGTELESVYGQLAAAPPACALRAVEPEFEHLDRRFEFTCQAPGLQALPLTYSRFDEVWVGGRRVQPLRSPQDPRLLLQLPQGPTSVRVLEPNFWRVLRGA